MRCGSDLSPRDGSAKGQARGVPPVGRIRCLEQAMGEISEVDQMIALEQGAQMPAEASDMSSTATRD